MSISIEFDGPRLMRSGERLASHRLSQMCFDDIPDSGGEEPVLPPQFDQGETHLIACQGVPVSQISIFRTPLKIYDAVIQVGSIGGVCTHPDFRGYGLATRIMEHCTRRLREGGAQLLLISGARGLYTRLGNVLSGKYAEFCLEAGGLHNSGYHGEVRPIQRSDSVGCSRIYQAEPVHFIRPVYRFEQYCKPHEIGYHAEEWMVEQDGQPTAYLMLSIPWEYLDQPEAGIRGLCEYAGSRVALTTALAEILNQPASSGSYPIQEIQFPVAWQDNDFIQLLLNCGGNPQWAALQEHTWRILNFPAMMKNLRPLIKARLEPALLRGLRFEQSGPLLGGKSDGFCVVLRGRDRLVLSTAEMTNLVMGDPYNNLVANIHMPGALAEIIPALFPLPSFQPGLDYH